MRSVCVSLSERSVLLEGAFYVCFTCALATLFSVINVRFSTGFGPRVFGDSGSGRVL